MVSYLQVFASHTESVVSDRPQKEKGFRDLYSGGSVKDQLNIRFS